MVTSVHAPETREDALIRLADQARTSGVRLYQDRADGRYFASSASKPGTLHYLTGYSCDCLGFVTHGRCKHHAALMAALGWIDGTPDPEPAGKSLPPDELATCPTCHGSGVECGTVPTGRSWRYENVVCGTCHGRGIAAAA